jgi:hypothetical protein
MFWFQPASEHRRKLGEPGLAQDTLMETLRKACQL